MREQLRTAFPRGSQPSEGGLVGASRAISLLGVAASHKDAALPRPKDPSSYSLMKKKPEH